MRPITLATIAAIVLLPGGSIAAAEDDETIDEISVVATRRSTSVEEIPIAVGTVPGDAVIEQALVTDALAQAPGVSLQQTTPGQGAAIVRGLKGSALLHLVDGMRLSNAMFRTAPTPWFALVPATSVDHIEVIRGTPASLFGSEAVGGVIQSVSRMPRFDGETTEYAGDLVLGLDSANLQRSLRATLDAGTRELAASLSAEYIETGNRRTGAGERVGPSGWSAWGARAVVQGRPTETRKWFVDLHFLEQPETPRFDELVPGFGQVEPSSDEFVFKPNQRFFAHVQHDHISDRGIDWKIDAAWQRIVDDRTTRNFGADVRRFEDNRSDLYGLTVNASGDYGEIGWIAGIDLYYDEVRSARSEQDLASSALTPLAPRFPDGSTITQTGLFTKLDWQAAEQHRISIGIRWSDVAIDLPDGTDIEPSELSGDIGWLFDVTDEWQVVANVGSGFRAPNIADLGTLGERPGNRFNVPNQNLEPETVTHIDLGLRYRAGDWRVELVGYTLRYDERIVSVGTGGTTPSGRDIVRSANAASSELYGFEAALAVALSDRVDFEAMVNYARGDQRVDDVDEPADRVPPLHGRITLRAAISAAWTVETWLVGAAEQDRLSARDVRDVRIDPDGTPGWVSIGARARWEGLDGWEMAAGVDNIFDQRYRVHGSGIDAPGTNLSLNVRRRW